MKQITFLLMAIFMTSWLSFSQTPTTVATFNISSCPDAQSTTVAYDAAVEGLVWVEVIYDGSCFSLTTDTETSNFDTEIGVYDAAGNLIGNNDDGGTGTLSSFTEGLAAGTYYVVAGGFNVAFGATDFDVTTTATSTTGSLSINVSTQTPPPPPTIDGSIAINGCDDSDTYSEAYDSATQGIVWVELIYDGGCSELTVDTENSDFDTEIGLYDATGTLIGSNDDDSGGITPQSLFTEAGLPAGTYYIAAGRFNVTFSDAFGASTSNSNTVGTVFINASTPSGCIPATIDSSTVDDSCNPDGTGTFTIDHIVSDAGDAGSVLDDGTNTYPVVLGTVTTGPYNSGDSITVELVAVEADCSSTVGTFEFTCPQPAPANDLCGDAEAIECGDSVTGSTAEATDTEGNLAPDVFYSLAGTALNEEVTVSLCGTSFDTVLTVFDACGGTQVEVNDDSCGLQSELTFTSDGATTYIIRVEGFGSNSGDYALAVTCVPPPACTQAVIDSSTVVENCNPDGTGTFTIDHIVSNAGDAGTNLDDGTTTYPVVLGTVTTGPYNSGDSVTIELTGVDPACDFTVGTFDFTCPQPAPDNDEIAGAFDLPVGNTACETIVPGTNIGATTSVENDNEASCSSSDPAGDVWFKVMVPSTGDITIAVTASDTDPIILDTVMEVYSGTSGALVEIECDDDDGDGLLSLVALTGQTPGEILLVRVWEWQDNFKGNFNICAWSPTSLGVEDNTFAGFTYYPNPVKDVLTLDSPRAIDNIEVFNVLGQRIIAIDSQNTIQNVDMSNVQSGAYLVKVSIGNQTKTIRVLKE